MLKYGAFSGPNAGKYGPGKTPYMNALSRSVAVGKRNICYRNFLQITIRIIIITNYFNLMLCFHLHALNLIARASTKIMIFIS